MAQILIVDDSFVARKALRKIMTDLGHTVVSEAGDGAQAFAEYAAHRPDIVMMDLSMAGISGTEATSKISATFPEALIIVVSASEDRSTVLEALEQGARHYLIKPVTAEKVSATLQHVLNQSFNQQKHRELISKLKEAREPSVEAQKIRRARVLIVDDSSVARKSLREIITSLGHMVVGEADNGAQAFVEYAQHKPDIVTMDLTMQGMSGAEATSKIISTFPNAKIIVISAMEERRVVVDALERGARHFIIKPITQEKVAAVLNNVLLQKFDLQKHMRLVQKLKGSDGLTSSTLSATNEYLPPYEIILDNKLICVKVTDKLTETSCQSLVIELEEHLTGSPRVLFDFGITAKLKEAVLLELDKLIKSIEASSGLVKAVSRSQSFVDSCMISGQCSYLSSAIRYLAK